MGVKISELLPKPVDVDAGIGTFQVRALNMKELVQLIVDHREGMVALFDGGMAGDLSRFVDEAPDLSRDIIALSAGVTDSEEIEAIEQLPGTVQLVALLEIWRLTVPQPKKLVELLSALRTQVEKAKVVAETQKVGPAPIPTVKS